MLYSPNHLLSKSEFVTDNKVQRAALQTACTSLVFPAKNVTRKYFAAARNVYAMKVLAHFPVPGGPYSSTDKSMN